MKARHPEHGRQGDNAAILSIPAGQRSEPSIHGAFRAVDVGARLFVFGMRSRSRMEQGQSETRGLGAPSDTEHRTWFRLQMTIVSNVVVLLALFSTATL